MKDTQCVHPVSERLLLKAICSCSVFSYSLLMIQPIVPGGGFYYNVLSSFKLCS